MTKRDVIKAIQRLTANAIEEEKSAKRHKARIEVDYGSKDYERWIEPDETRLLALRAQGYDYDVIARELRRTTRSVRTKYLELRDREAVKAAEKLIKKMGKNVI
jgi:hypothetical protein